MERTVKKKTLFPEIQPTCDSTEKAAAFWHANRLLLLTQHQQDPLKQSMPFTWLVRPNSLTLYIFRPLLTVLTFLDHLTCSFWNATCTLCTILLRGRNSSELVKASPNERKSTSAFWHANRLLLLTQHQQDPLNQSMPFNMIGWP